MKTEIPKEDGWYWMKREGFETAMTRAYTDHDGLRFIVVMNNNNPTGLAVYHQEDQLEGATFTKIEVPR